MHTLQQFIRGFLMGILTFFPVWVLVLGAWLSSGCGHLTGPEPEPLMQIGKPVPMSKMQPGGAVVIQVTKERKCFVIFTVGALDAECWNSYAPRINP